MGTKIYSTLLIFYLTLFSILQDIHSKEIQWQTSILKAMEIAKKEKKTHICRALCRLVQLL
jgi:hypothetical protein